jgi:hypothetical protein
LFPTNVNKFGMLCLASSPTTLSVPIYDFASAHEGLAGEATEEYRYPCCGAFVKVVPTPYIVLESRETIRSARFAIQPS